VGIAAVEHQRVFRLLDELDDLALFIGVHDSKTGCRRAIHRNGAYCDVRVCLKVLAQDMAVVHAIELVAAQNDVVIHRSLEEVAKVLPDCVGSSLIPMRSLRRLLCRQNLNETRGKIVKLVARIDVAVQRHAIELSEHIDAADAGV
jgi:hypothetical protein